MSWPSLWLTSRSWCQELFDVGEGILNGFGQNTQTQAGAAETKELGDGIEIGVNQVWSEDDGIPWSAPQTRNGISNWSLLDASCPVLDDCKGSVFFDRQGFARTFSSAENSCF